LLLIGDIVGKPGRQIVSRAVPGLRIEQNLDLVVANAENAAGGSGLTPVIYHELVASGVDCVTKGDHIYRRREIYSVLEREERIVRPANYPEEAPGRAYTVIETARHGRVVVFSLLGRVFMPPVDCPFQSADQVIAQLPSDIRVILVDFHAEATSDKQLMGRFLDGRVTAVLGTHTHVPTADEQILRGGTAYHTDVGMTGPHDSILGRRVDRVLETVRTFRPTHFEVASGDVRLNGAIVEADPETGRAQAIHRVCIDQGQADRLASLVAKEERGVRANPLPTQNPPAGKTQEP
jgi:metallophosphoesterase (TIGR00282 family)